MPDEGSANPTPTTPGPTPTQKVLTPSSETRPAKDKQAKKQKPEPTTIAGKLWYNWIKPIGSVVIVVVVVRSMLIDWNDVPTGSMEPEIAVGDRIAVNRLAYALQAPLTGPQIGVPFTPLQWDNPLDGIPQWQWGRPKRGDIVTFWNPVTKVRMVKRIVAEPNDTIAMSGGVMTINGTAATYVDLDAAAEGLPTQTKYLVQSSAGGKKRYDYRDLEYRKETLLGETRTVQYIKQRWLLDAQVLELPNGERALIDEGRIQLGLDEDGEVYQPKTQNPLNTPVVLATAKDGVLYLDGKPVDYNTFAAALLKRYSTGEEAKALANYGLKIEGHRFFIDDKEVSNDLFGTTLGKQAFPKMSQQERAVLIGLDKTLYVVLGRASMSSFGPVTLGEDQYLMVGDNRNNSHDGRAFGPIDRGEITGEAFAVAFSFKDNSYTSPNWKRFFTDLE